MVFYLTLFTAVSISSFFYSRSRDIYLAQFSKLFAFLLMFIPAALRYRVGTDYFSYVLNYSLISRGFPARFEPGFVALNQLSDYLNLGAQGVFAITAFLTLFFLFLAVPRKSFYIIVPVYFCMFYAFSFNAIRNALAIAIAYYAYQVFCKKKILLSFALIGIGSLFHISVLLFYPMFITMLVLKINKTQTIIFFILSLTIYFFGSVIIDWILEVIVSRTSFAYYLDTKFIERSRTSLLFVFVQLFVVSIVLFFMPNDKNTIISNIFIFLLVANFAYMLGSILDIFNRLYRVFSIVWLPVIQYLNNYKSKLKKIFLLLFIFFWAFGSFIIAVGFMGSADMIPYRTIFS